MVCGSDKPFRAGLSDGSLSKRVGQKYVAGGVLRFNASRSFGAIDLQLRREAVHKRRRTLFWLADPSTASRSMPNAPSKVLASVPI